MFKYPLFFLTWLDYLYLIIYAWLYILDYLYLIIYTWLFILDYLNLIIDMNLEIYQNSQIYKYK